LVNRVDGRRGEMRGLAYRSLTLALLFGCILLLILVSGCSSPPPADGDTPPAPEILVEYRRTGGIAGFDDHLVVFENGQAIYTRRETPGSTPAGIFYLSDEEMTELRKLLEEADFSGLASEYPAPVPGADYFTYSITYEGKTVTTETTGVPPALSPVIGELDYLLAEGS
jgi:hypothetical protein